MIQRKTPQSAWNSPGAAQVAGQRHIYDPDRRAAAARIDQREPCWVVWYGPWSRRFYAASTRPSSKALIVEADEEADLVARMRHAECEVALAADHPMAARSALAIAR